MTRRRLLVGVAVLVVVALIGFLVIGALLAPSSSSPSASASPSPSVSSSPSTSPSPSGGSAPTEPAPSPSAGPSALLPQYPEPYGAETVGPESTRVADLMVGFVDLSESGGSNVVNDDAVAQVVPGEDGTSYYGVLHTLTLDPSVDAAAQVRALAGALVSGGWTERDTSDAQGQSLIALTSDAEEARSWFLVIGADLSVPGESVVTIQLASPDLP